MGTPIILKTKENLEKISKENLQAISLTKRHLEDQLKN